MEGEGIYALLRLLQMFLRLVVLPEAAVEEAELIVNDGGFGIEGDGLFQALAGGFELVPGEV